MTQKNKMSGELSLDKELFIVSAPSGTGKTTLCRKLTVSVPRLIHSVSYTTRVPRKDEIRNVHYTFISNKRFMTMVNKGEFAEWAVVHGNLYGTSIKRLLKMSKRGYDIILDVDTQGAKQIKRIFKNAVSIFILPPSMKVLEQRLRGRKSDLTQEIKNRLKRAKDEIADYKCYDYIIINDKLNRAFRELESIVIAIRLRTENINTKIIKI